jgi:hypothetical protein
LAVLIGGFVLAVWLVWRKKFALKKLKKPNFQGIAFGKDLAEEVPPLSFEQKEALKAIEEVLISFCEITLEISKGLNILTFVVALGSTHEIAWCNL